MVSRSASRSSRADYPTSRADISTSGSSYDGKSPAYSEHSASQASHLDEFPVSDASSHSSRSPSACRSQSALRASHHSAASQSPYGDDRNECVASLAASLENNQSQIAELGAYFIGMKTADEAAALTTPTAMRLYYQMPANWAVPSRLPLFLVYQSSDEQHFHFPIVQERGRWRVKYGESNKLSYPSLVSLMRHHLNYLFASPYVPGAFDSFEVWKAYVSI